MTLVCTKGATFNVQMSSTHGLAMVGQGGVLLHYGLYQDDAHAKAFDVPYSGTAASALVPVTIPYYVQAPPGQDLPAGVVSDTVTVQVTF